MPSRRGVWLEVASGQMLRQMPGATMNSSGQGRDDDLPHHEQAGVGDGDQQAGDDERADPADRADRPPRREAQAARDLRVVGERDRGHQPVHPAIRSLACAEAGGEDRAEVGEDRAAEVGPPRAQRQEGLVAEAQRPRRRWSP